MITVYIGGGLANKMFQYAFSLSIKKLGYDVGYDTHTFKTEFEHDQVLIDDIFPNVSIRESEDSYWAAGKNSKIARLYKRFSSSYVIEHAYQYNPEIWQQLKRKCFVESSWQDERYFKDAKSEVRRAFEFYPFEGERNIAIATEMKESESVAVHIRKGDGYATWNIFQNTCPKSYYKCAISYIKERMPGAKFFVFSDIPSIVNDFMGGEDYTLIDWNPAVGRGNHLDMQLMSCAKHNVIANSTYSWWGAWLNANSNKTVVAPEDWFNPYSSLAGINHIIPESWMKL